MTKYVCRLCFSASLSNSLVLSSSPRNVQRLYRQNDFHLDKSVELRVLTCHQCGFVQVDPVLEEEYYDDYMMLASHSPQVQEYQRRQSFDFVHEYDLTGKIVKEIGCGDGSYLSHLKAAGCLPFGIEPSAPSRKRAIDRGHNVEGGYVTPTTILEHSPFDAFVTRQVLEHVPDIHGFLNGIHRNLKLGAVGLVEVPSLDKLIKDRRYYDFFPDHVNYFSSRTLRMALELTGFEVLDVRHDMFDEYVVAYVRKISPPNLEDVANTKQTLGSELRTFIDRYHQQGLKVAVWGAGGKGLSVLADAGIFDVDILIDGDPNKQGLYTPVTHLLIQSPEVLKESKASAVIVTAMAYKNEITNTLVNDLNFLGDIAYLGHHLEMLDKVQ